MQPNLVSLEELSPRSRTIHSAYYDVRRGFQSAENTDKEIRELHPEAGITLQHVKHFLAKQKVHQQTFRQLPLNSYVPSNAREQFQIDLAFFQGSKYRVGCFIIDIFTKRLAKRSN